MAQRTRKRHAETIRRALSKKGPTVFSQRDIQLLLSDLQEDNDIPRSLGIGEFIEELLLIEDFRVAELKFPSRKVRRWLWMQSSIYQLASTLRPNGYFSHYSAMEFHDLTEQLPRTIYFNDEQSPKPAPAGPLEQKRIDWAFRRKPRRTKACADWDGYTICLLSGKCSNRLGVVTSTASDGIAYPVTGIERTLIDISVRPFYAGGVFEVLDAFRAAADRVDVDLLRKTLEDLDYKYPYHQAIGYYMENSGAYGGDAIEAFKAIPQAYDFYLTFQMNQPTYVKHWRLYVPQGF